jgi:hypothetical protein
MWFYNVNSSWNWYKVCSKIETGHYNFAEEEAQKFLEKNKEKKKLFD